MPLRLPGVRLAPSRSVSIWQGCFVAVWAVAASIAPGRVTAGEVDSAAAIYREQCATCHGSDGQGEADGYSEPLSGDYSIAALTRIIERTMPEGDPDSCVGEDARRVAEYVYHEFYSLEARQRKGLAPRVELARLTVPQYRNAVADLIGHFAGSRNGGSEARGGAHVGDTTPEAAPEPGLRAEYFQSKGMNKADDLRHQRVDRSVEFDFGEGSPADGIEPDQFAIIWEGGLTAPETGYYEFRIRSENGARLYVNREGTGRRGKLRDDSAVAGEAALIDGWVSSGEMRELSGRIFLLGGRRYPFRLEFFKYLQKTASIELQWKPPQGTWAVLDHHHLTAAPAARVFVVETPFPADDRSTGYERGSAISPAWHTATTDAAVATAAEVIDRLPQLAGLDADRDDAKDRRNDEQGEEDQAKRRARLQDFVARFASVAFRRPLSDAEEHLFREVLFADAADPKAAVRRAILLILASPHFLYTDLAPAGEAPTQYAVASRLALTLWDSIPDATLLEAAREGQLGTAEQVEAQAERMIASPRARAKMRAFFHAWLEIGERDLTKDPEKFMEFDEATIADLRFSLEQFIDQVVWSEPSDYRQLLLADYLVLNDRLRRLYEADAVAAPVHDSDFLPVPFDPQQRAGLLTHPYLLSAFAYHNNTSPIHRGVFLARNVVGRGLRPPPVAVAFKDDEFDPSLTMREKITQLTSDAACASCHQVINPLGFALENYDAIGRWRTSDNQKPIDSTAEYTTAEGETLKFHSARDVAHFAAGSESAQRAFITTTFHHVVKQTPAAYGADVVDKLHGQFKSDNYSIQRLWIRIATLAATAFERETDS